MNDMITFFTTMMGHTALWLNSEPIRYFTAIFIGAGVVGLVSKMMHIK